MKEAITLVPKNINTLFIYERSKWSHERERERERESDRLGTAMISFESFPSRLGLSNTPTASLQRNKSPPTSVLM